MKKENKGPTAFRAIALRVTALALAMWLAGMGLLTWAVAADQYRQLRDAAWHFASTAPSREPRGEDYPEELPGSRDVGMIQRLGDAYYFLNTGQLLPIVLPQTPSSYGSDDWIWGKWDLLYGYEAAVLYSDGQGQPLMGSGSYLYFAYTSGEDWAQGDVQAQGLGYLDLGAYPEALEALSRLIVEWPAGDPVMLMVSLLRLTGYFEGSRFCPTLVERSRPLDRDYEISQLSKLDARGELEWETVAALPGDPARAQETIYTWDMGGIRSEYDSLTYEGVRYESLTDFLQMCSQAPGTYTRESLLDGLIVCQTTREDSYGTYRFTLAVRCWPLEYALFRLWPVYLVSGGLTALAVYLILRRIRDRLTRPLEWLAWGGYRNVTSHAWQEPRILDEMLEAGRQSLAEARNEVRQLRAALDYAQDAEENRRQLVSNITHELKTPLAVIHSYAEGLQSGVAGEKQEQYLSVILEEAQRMDGMVMEMLDLSRLEAGRVRLAEDHFCLLALTQTIVEKLEPMARERELELLYSQAQSCPVIADEGRMGQVVTNLVTNALHYTAPGGRIWLRICPMGGEAHFQIINTAPHLPPEVLEKVFDSFYRADPSRGSKGTGLGLAIARSILTLHGGKITAANTRMDGEACVEFTFTLPLS